MGALHIYFSESLPLSFISQYNKINISLPRWAIAKQFAAHVTCPLINHLFLFHSNKIN
jgi:hypothetical protein